LVEGRVKLFNENKKFGIIETESGRHHVFVPFSAIRDTGFKCLSEGERVCFVEESGNKGPQAAQVRKI
jgi:cold shock protein